MYSNGVLYFAKLIVVHGFIGDQFKANQWRTQEFCSGGGGQQIRLRTEDRENVDLGALAP